MNSANLHLDETGKTRETKKNHGDFVGEAKHIAEFNHASRHFDSFQTFGYPQHGWFLLDHGRGFIILEIISYPEISFHAIAASNKN